MKKANISPGFEALGIFIIVAIAVILTAYIQHSI